MYKGAQESCLISHATKLQAADDPINFICEAKFYYISKTLQALYNWAIEAKKLKSGSLII